MQTNNPPIFAPQVPPWRNDGRVGTSVDDELDNPTENTTAETNIIHNAQGAWQRLKISLVWQDWTTVGAAHVIGRTTAMHDARTNKPAGRGYNAAFAAWARRFGLPSDPWRDTRYVYLIDPRSGKTYSFVTDSVGGRRAKRRNHDRTAGTARCAAGGAAGHEPHENPLRREAEAGLPDCRLARRNTISTAEQTEDAQAFGVPFDDEIPWR